MLIGQEDFFLKTENEIYAFGRNLPAQMKNLQEGLFLISRIAAMRFHPAQ